MSNVKYTKLNITLTLQQKYVFLMYAELSCLFLSLISHFYLQILKDDAAVSA